MPAPQDKRDAAKDATGPARRKPYATPRLKAYGPVAKLTQGTSSSGNDFGNMQKNTMCL